MDLHRRDGCLESRTIRQTRGGQRKFSCHANETALKLRLVFELPLRQAEGFLRSVLFLMVVDLETPDHTTLSRRSQHLNIRLAGIAVDRPLHLVVDSTGLSILDLIDEVEGTIGRLAWRTSSSGTSRSSVTACQLRWLSACDYVAATPCSSSEVAGSRGADRLQHFESDDYRRQARILCDRRLMKIVGVGELFSRPHPCTDAAIRRELGDLFDRFGWDDPA